MNMLVFLLSLKDWYKTFGVESATSTLGILLFIIVVFDIHKTVFKFIVNKVKRANKDHIDWPKKPRRWRLQFPLITYLKVRKLRKKVAEDRLKKLEDVRSKMSELFKGNKSADNNIEFHYEKFQSRKQLQFDEETINLINGLPGTGKTTEIIHHIKSSIQYKDALFFYFDNNTVQNVYKNLLEEPNETNVLNTWEIFRQVLLDKRRKDNFYDADFLSYYFNNKPVVLFFDGFTKIKNIQNLTINLHRYFSMYHAKNENIKIFLTSRNKNLKDIYIPVKHVWINTITKEDAEKYFFAKCKELGVNLAVNRQFHKVIENKNSVLRFDHPLTKTPLFVEIVLLIISENNFDSEVETFQRSVPHVYRRFIETLYMRSNAKESFTEVFYQKYRDLGYAVFGQGNSFTIEYILKYFKPEDEINLTFLLHNGLIFEKKVRGKNRYEFIHKSLPDILYIEQIVKKEDYKTLSKIEGLGDEFLYYLSDSIDTIDQFLSLIKQSLKTASKTFTLQLFERLSNDTRRSCKKILIEMNSCLFNKQDSASEVVYFIELFNRLKEAYGNTVYEQLQLMKETNLLNEELILILLSLEDNEFDKFIIEKIKSQQYSVIFKRFIENDNKKIIGLILKLIDSKIKHSKEQNDFVNLLSNSKSELAKEKIQSWIFNNLPFFNKDDCQQLLSDTVFDDIIFKNYTHKTTDKTKDLNKVIQGYYSKYKGSVFFLPKGMYNIGNKQVNIGNSILVSRSPSEIYVEGENMNRVEMNAVNLYNKKLWTFEHMKVAYTFFEASLQNGFFGTFVGLSSVSQKGIIFEAYKENSIGKLRLSGFKGKSNGLVNQSHYDQNEIKENIIYREVHQIH